MSVKYKNPPINELIIGVYFEPLIHLRSEHVGLFWAEKRKLFPKIQQQSEIPFPLGGGETIQIQVTDEPYPMPRFWLLGEDGSVVLQIQKNAFILNWRKRNNEYPSFEKVKSEFDAHFESFKRFIHAEFQIPLRHIQVAELTYSNVVEAPTDYWNGTVDTVNILPAITVPELGVPTEGHHDFSFVTMYKLRNDLSLQVSVRTGRKLQDANQQVLVFEFKAVGPLGGADKMESDDWFGRAHQAIRESFKSMTNPEIRTKYWQPVSHDD